MQDQEMERVLRIRTETWRKATEKGNEKSRGAHEGKKETVEIMTRSGTNGGTKLYLRKCRLCGWAATSQKELDDHKSTHMQMDRTVKCLQCSLVFFDQRDLRAHEKAVHKLEFHCVYCDKKFRMAAYLEKHMVQHKMLTEDSTATESVQEKLPTRATPSAKKIFKCKVCLKTFKKKSSWKKHSRLHL